MIRKHRLELIGVLCGAIGGFAYYYFVGCANGSCIITSNPYVSTLYGAVLGGLAFSLLKTSKKVIK